MPLMGYACVAIGERTPPAPVRGLESAGCAELHEEQVSGGNRERPVLVRLLEQIGNGDTLVVVRIDLLARSLSHLHEVIKQLDAQGLSSDCYRTRSIHHLRRGKFTLQVLGNAAAFECALI